jgi:SAM-dependent methyltransferase
MTMMAEIEPTPATLAEFFSGQSFESKPRWAWPFKNYKSTVIGLAKRFGKRALCEIGGGRAPMLSREAVEDLRAEYTVLDISQAELDCAPAWSRKLKCDIGGGDPVEIAGQYDLMFSHMVMEHVRDVRRAYANIFHLLAPGGIVINFHPTLYAVPFVINRYSPESLTRPLVELFDTNRGKAGRPKFPAYYSWCVSTEKAERMIRDTGFREVLIVPFWGHSYFERIPVLREIDRAIVTAAERRRLKSLSSYAYTIARK